MKNLKSLPDDIFSLFDPEYHHVVNEENLEAFANNIKQLVRDRLKRNEREFSIRFSNLGRNDRQLWYEANKPEEAEQMSPKTLLKFLYGDVIEQLMLLLVKEAGHTVELEQQEIEVDGIKGHIDAIIDGVVVDVKSASPHSYKKFEDKTLITNPESDAFGYIKQLSGYGKALGKPAAFLPFDKVHGDICVLELPSETIAQNHPEERIAHLKDILSRPEMPPRCYSDVPDGKSGNMKLATGCGYCAFKHSCWPGLRTFLYSGGPRFLTKVVREPDVFEAE